MIRSQDSVVNYKFSRREIIDLIRDHTDALLPPEQSGVPVEISGIAAEGVLVSITYLGTAPYTEVSDERRK